MVVTIFSRTYIRKFQEVNATSPEYARTLADLGLPDTWIFRRMVSQGVFLPCEDGRFCLQQATARAFVKAEGRRLVIGGAILILLLSVYVIWLIFAHF
ncbi:MAG: hypothetical protein JSU70_15630 [Phycisphaerales bacterium]|nr:MAG: hypothetical protein JSU70_15630 [Phycisphaerales bacterium]